MGNTTSIDTFKNFDIFVLKEIVFNAIKDEQFKLLETLLEIDTLNYYTEFKAIAIAQKNENVISFLDDYFNKRKQTLDFWLLRQYYGYTNLGALTSLSLSDNKQLSHISPEICELTNLQELRITLCNISVLPTEIGNMSNLVSLFLCKNNLTVLPTEIGKLYNLQKLFVNNNNLISLPTEIGNLSNLYYLNVDFNNLENLPKEICNLNCLRSLHAENNKFKYLPAGIINFAKKLPASCFDDNIIITFMSELPKQPSEEQIEQQLTEKQIKQLPYMLLWMLIIIVSFIIMYNK